jgi:hypothetical protein
MATTKRATKAKRSRAAAPSSASGTSVARQVAGFIAKFNPTNQRLIRATRAALRKRFPTAVEMVYDNYNFFVIGYGPSERASDAFVSMAAYARGVGICFIQGARLADPDRVLEGSGNQTRMMRLKSAKDLAAPAVETLLRAACRLSPPLPKSGRGRTVIKSISAKQRPRRVAPR